MQHLSDAAIGASTDSGFVTDRSRCSAIARGARIGLVDTTRARAGSVPDVGRAARVVDPAARRADTGVPVRSSPRVNHVRSRWRVAAVVRG